jgi:hypothetical protein
MLISPIDRNREPEPEKHVSRINSPYWTLPSNGGLGAPQKNRSPHSSEGIILRVRDTRLSERRKIPTEFQTPERRKKNNRNHDLMGNTTNHHVMIIALKHEAGKPELWKAGDRVSVVTKSQTLTPKNEALHPTDNQTSNPPLLTRDDQDYVLHLSKRYPEEM